MRFARCSIATATFALAFFSYFPAMAGGPIGAVAVVDTVPDIVWVDTTHVIYNVRFAPDDSYIISSGGSTDMRIYDPKTWDVFDTIESGTEDIFTGFIFSKDGKYLVAKTPKLIKVYDAKTFRLLKVLKDSASIYDIKVIDISPDNRFIVMAAVYNFYCVWEWQTGKSPFSRLN